MLIIIKSRENGWETERRMELPEDDGLVKSILRSVKRRVNPPANAEGVIENQELKEAARQEPLPAADKEPAEDVRTVFETGARGFLPIRCASCGKEYSFNAKDPRRRACAGRAEASHSWTSWPLRSCAALPAGGPGATGPTAKNRRSPAAASNAERK